MVRNRVTFTKKGLVVDKIICVRLLYLKSFNYDKQMSSGSFKMLPANEYTALAKIMEHL